MSFNLVRLPSYGGTHLLPAHPDGLAHQRVETLLRKFCGDKFETDPAARFVFGFRVMKTENRGCDCSGIVRDAGLSGAGRSNPSAATLVHTQGMPALRLSMTLPFRPCTVRQRRHGQPYPIEISVRSST